MVVKNPISNAGDVGWIPGWATKLTHDYWAHFLYSPLTITIQPQATAKSMGSQKKKKKILKRSEGSGSSRRKIRMLKSHPQDQKARLWAGRRKDVQVTVYWQIQEILYRVNSPALPPSLTLNLTAYSTWIPIPVAKAAHCINNKTGHLFSERAWGRNKQCLWPLHSI